MKHINSLVLLCSIYLLTIVMGLHTAAFIQPLMYPPKGGEPVIQPAVDDPESVSSAGYFFVSILAITFVMLVFMKYRLGFFIKAAMLVSFFTGTLFTSTALFGDAGVIIPIVFSALILLRFKSELFYDVVLVFTISGVGALLGSSLGLVPALVLVVIMSVYDFVAVFFTKHMVSLAKGAVEGGVPMMFAVPVGDRFMHLGAGDVALPLTLSVSVMASQGIIYAIPTALGGVIGIITLFSYIQNKKGATLPALPPIVGGQLIGYGLAILVQAML
ncbi:MAG: hypothetical protein KKD39_00180 [Candidatus Altiarchaeota archaeon]|nr:hypothetical protein [Candidatus Altiarchaeota archaeon]